MSRKLTQQDFIDRSTVAHNYAYDYSAAVYTGRAALVNVTCKRHSEVFSQQAGVHMDGGTGCQACYTEKRQETRAKNTSDNHIDGFKRCNSCSRVLTVDSFVPNKDGAGGLYSVCRGCCKVRSDAAQKAITKCPHKSARKKDRAAEYTRNNREAANVKSAVRRANRLSRTPPWVDSEFESLFIAEIYHLAKLREQETGFKWQVDHMVPFISDKVCGFHCSDNMQLIPAFENLSKGNKYWPDMP